MKAKTNCQNRLSLYDLWEKYRWYAAVTKIDRPKNITTNRATAVQVIPVKITAKHSRCTRKKGIEESQFTRSSAAREMGVVIAMHSAYLPVGRLKPLRPKSPLTWTFANLRGSGHDFRRLHRKRPNGPVDRA